MLVVDFPSNWKNKRHLSFDGILVTHDSLKTLLPHKYIDDVIIDSFVALQADLNRTFNILYFGVHNIRSLMQNESLILTWSERVEPQRFNVWLMPLHDDTVYGVGHWTLFVVIIHTKQILYLDSMHGEPLGIWTQKICSYIEYILGKKPNWSEWKINAPIDIPRQGGVENSSGNCGIHLLMRCYIIYTGRKIQFSKIEMNKARA